MTHKAPHKTEPTTQMPKRRPSEQSQNEGEGNRTADREYRQNVERHVKSGKSGRAAQDAARAVEGEEADDLREAERQGKAADTRPRIADRTEDQRAREDQGNRTRH